MKHHVDIGCLDRSRKAQHAAAVAALAEGRGFVGRAQMLRVESAKHYLRQSRGLRRPEQRAVGRFAAATQYYRGGYFHRADRLSRDIDPRFLCGQHRELWEEFRRDVRRRVKSGQGS